MTNFSDTQLKAIDVCLKNQVAFVVFRKSGSAELRFMCDTKEGESASRTSDRFFTVGYLEKFINRTEIRDMLSEEQVLKMFGSTNRQPIYQGLIPASTPKDDYLSGINRIIERLKRDGGKTVISRLITGTPTIDIAHAAQHVFEVNPNAFCALFYTKETGCWLVASPEKLLSFNLADSTFRTMSLAGTRSISEGNDAWDAKNIDEQEIVTNYISSILTSSQLKNISTSTKTLKSNNVEHICTLFSGTFDNVEQFQTVADALSPTPALAGSPRDVAIEEISHTEAHQRALYSGYIGFSTNSEISAHVMLRCARLYPNGYCIYSGSGVTAQSNALDEWNETELKAASLRQIFDSSTNCQ